VGKSAQIPLFVWLPDAMEGPTPVSALIHAATMVAAGVFLIARVYPLVSAGGGPGNPSVALQVITWVGATTAVFAAFVAVAQNDIKRILAYSTVSQLGYMMLGLGVGGIAVGMFHLITHAFFKALLFLGAGSVIHGCHHEQDIRRLGDLRKRLPVTFATYAVGMLALSGFPLLFSGFWSKDEILHAAHAWPASQWPFFLGLAGAFLTAFYMTRQVWYVFFACRKWGAARGKKEAHLPHESPRVMTIPLVLLAVGAVLLSFIGTPAWPWFQSWLDGEPASLKPAALFSREMVGMMLVSTGIVVAGLGLAGFLYSRRQKPGEPDLLQQWRPDLFGLLERKFYFDEIYQWSVVRFNGWWSRMCQAVEQWVLAGVTELVALAVTGLSWASRAFDEFGINRGFDAGCSGFNRGGSFFARLQNGQVQRYLRGLGLAVAVLVLALLWGGFAR